MMNIGERIREARLRRQLSLSDVANEVRTSVATLSRIETNKQSLDLNLFLELARILEVSPADLLDVEPERASPEATAAELPTLHARDRLKFWRDLSAANKARRSNTPATDAALMGEIDELFAQVELVRDELDAVRKKLRRRARKN